MKKEIMKKEISNLKNWIKNKVVSAHKDGVVIGISGGIDSSVVAALCVKALGPAKVHGIFMPCDGALYDNDAEKIFNTGINREYIDLTGTFYRIRDAFGSLKSPMALANIKPRLRMTALYAYAQENNLLVAGTTNRTEWLIGYFTKWGDGGVDIEPIIGYYKTEVYLLARALKIPRSILTRAPSAGLWPGQTDEGEIGFTYKEMDCALNSILSGKFDNDNKCHKKMQALIGDTAHKKLPIDCYERS